MTKFFMKMMKTFINTPRVILALLCFAVIPSLAQSSDHGMELSAEGSHKLSRKASVSAEAEMRTRNDFKTMDRWSFGVDGSYKLTKQLKVSAGYSLLFDNNSEKISRNSEGDVTKWRPSYWGTRHRFNVSVAGSVDWNRFSFSLRERWQYTYRPEKETTRYDFGDEQWESRTVKGKGKNVLRSKFEAEYNIPKSKFDPYASVEIFNAWNLQKVRYVVGVDWKISKKQTLGAYYRYQTVNEDDDDNETNSHIIGFGYKMKF